MDIQALKTKIREVLIISKPFVQKIVDEKVIPAIRSFTYKHFQKHADKLINNLVKLKEKAHKETDGVKRQAHLIGLKLGAEALIAFGNKLIESGNILMEE